MGFTSHGRHLLMSRFFSTGSAPTNVWLALANVVLSDSDDAAFSLAPYEPAAAAGYARVQYAMSNGWYELSPGVMGNARGVNFTSPSADWGMLRGWAMCDSASGGLVIATAQLRQARRVTVGVPVQFRIDALQVAAR